MRNISKRNIRRLSSFLVALLCVGYGYWHQYTGKFSAEGVAPHIASSSATLYSVTRVVDGDTFHVSMDGNDETVRMLGIDTPEILDPRKKIECYAKEASEETKRLLTGKSVRLESDPTQGDRDKYGRLLRFVYLPDGTHVNDFLVRQGFAFEYTYNSIPYVYQFQFIEAEKAAREENRGLWAETACRGVR